MIGRRTPSEVSEANREFDNKERAQVLAPST